jgi:peptidoglycan/LPS O-acetylase OafA/YrhL
LDSFRIPTGDWDPEGSIKPPAFGVDFGVYGGTLLKLERALDHDRDRCNCSTSLPHPRMKPVQQPTTKQKSGAPRAVLQSHLPSLDGMRAISILLVIVAHASDVFDRQSDYLFSLGQLGVSVFFVISGLLITWLMIRERDATGTFSLRDFYIRRFLRILPVFWLLLLTVTVLNVAHVISIEWLDIVRALTFTHNYPLSMRHPRDYAFWLTHTWSLSLEEQFYLVWPGLFAILRPKHAARLAAILAFSGSFLRIANYYLLPSFRGLVGTAFHTRIDILMVGCASAFLLESPAWNARIKKIPVLPTLAATSIFLLVADPFFTNHFGLHSRANAIARLIVPTFEALAIALTLLIVVAGKPGMARSVLNWRVSTHIGKLSYSLYIWQQLFLAPHTATRFFPLLWRLPAIYVVSFCSFNFFERPFIKLRSRFRPGVSV